MKRSKLSDKLKKCWDGESHDDEEYENQVECAALVALHRAGYVPEHVETRKIISPIQPGTCVVCIRVCVCEYGCVRAWVCERVIVQDPCIIYLYVCYIFVCMCAYVHKSTSTQSPVDRVCC